MNTFLNRVLVMPWNEMETGEAQKLGKKKERKGTICLRMRIEAVLSGEFRCRFNIHEQIASNMLFSFVKTTVAVYASLSV